MTMVFEYEVYPNFTFVLYSMERYKPRVVAFWIVASLSSRAGHCIWMYWMIYTTCRADHHLDLSADVRTNRHDFRRCLPSFVRSCSSICEGFRVVVEARVS